MLNNLIKQFVIQFSLISLLFISIESMAASKNDAISLINNFHSALLDNMQNAESLGFQGRYDAISELIDENFDFPLIAKVILSRHWKQFSDEQKAKFIERLTELTKSTYAARFNEFTDEQFNTVGTDELKKGRLLVKTEIQSSTQEVVSLNYLLHPIENNWKIISVIANGVNDLSLKRAEYSVFIKEKGLDGLLKEINHKIQEYENF